MNKKIRTGVLAILCSLLLVACRTVPVSLDTTETELKAVEVMQTQTEIVSASKEVSATIDNIKEITDKAKETGIVPVTIIKYVDVLQKQNKTLTRAVEKQTVILPEFNKLRIGNNSDANKMIADKENSYQAEKNKAAIFIKWALIATFVSLVFAGIIFLPKLIKLLI